MSNGAFYGIWIAIGINFIFTLVLFHDLKQMLKGLRELCKFAHIVSTLIVKKGEENDKSKKG